MLCPHCSKPIDPALVRAAANKDAATRARPRAKGQAKTGCAHYTSAFSTESGNLTATCEDCNRPIRWNTKLKRWRIRYAKQKIPAA